MISEKTIMKKLEEWAKTSQGKAAIKEKYGIDYDDKTNKSLMKYANRMKAILYEHIHQVIKSIEMDDIVIGDFEVNSDGRLTIKLSFKDGSLHRESLRPDKYPKGIDNIVLLFTRGYDAGNPVFGVWKNSWSYPATIKSLQHREPNDFLKEAVEQFNSESGDIAQAFLESTYQ